MHYARLVQLLDALAPCPDESHVAIFTPEVRLETAMHTHSERALGGRWLVMILDVPLLEFGRAPRVAAEPAAAQIGGWVFLHQPRLSTIARISAVVSDILLPKLQRFF